MIQAGFSCFTAEFPVEFTGAGWPPQKRKHDIRLETLQNLKPRKADKKEKSIQKEEKQDGVCMDRI